MPALGKLWLHEVMRVFHDRLTDAADQELIKTTAHALLSSRFGCMDSFESVFEEGLPVLFADCARPGLTTQERTYEQVTGATHIHSFSLVVISRVCCMLHMHPSEMTTATGSCVAPRADSDRLVKSLEYFLACVDTAVGPPPSIVFFDGAIEHVLRLARILRHPGGHALLLGLGGSGKQTLARLAASVANCTLRLAKRGRGAGHGDFREVVRGAYEAAGVHGTKVCVLLTEGDLASSAHIEDVCSMLGTGDVHGLFSADECEVIFSKLRATGAAAGVAGSRAAMYGAFLRRVRSHLHVVLCMSPAGERFRDTCRRHPSLVSSCNVDWYAPWSAAGLRAVATRVLVLEPDAAAADELRAVVDVMPQMHAAVARAADAFEADEGRRVYVTPQSYLDHLALFSKLLDSKRASLGRERARVAGGLARMRDTEALVGEMERDLTALGPVLEEKTAATAALLRDVTSEQEEAEQMRIAIAGEEAEIKKGTLETEARTVLGCLAFEHAETCARDGFCREKPASGAASAAG